MTCLCQKISNKQYHDVAPAELAILRQTLIDAPHLFQTAPVTPHEIEPTVRKRPRNASLGSPLPPATKLTETYSPKNAETIFNSNNSLNLWSESSCLSITVEVFLSIKQTDKNIGIQQLIRRTYCYAFAQLHEKNHPIDPIVREIKDALPETLETDIRTKTYEFLRIGRRWVEIIEQFALILNRDPRDLVGLLCLLESPSSWERAPPNVYQSALMHLCKNTDICQETLKYSSLLQKGLDRIYSECSFVNSSGQLAPRSKTYDTILISQSRQSETRIVSTRRDLHTMPTCPPWKAASLAAVSETVPEVASTCSEDTMILFVLLSFLSASDNIPVDLLLRGAARRKRWTAQGEIKDVHANQAGLAPEICDMLLDRLNLSHTFEELCRCGAMMTGPDQTYTLHEAITRRVRDGLFGEHLCFWRRQALVVAYRAIPWKYVEPAASNVGLYLPHLKHALQAFDGFADLPTSTKADIVLTLVEASRFPGMVHKRFLIDQAEIATSSLDDRYLRSCIAQSQCILHRISGQIDRAVHSLGELSQDNLSTMVDERMHSADGHVIIQRSLNCIQVEDLSTAKTLLEEWNTLNQHPSPIEKVVMFRKDMIFGRILRFEGEFEKSRVHLERAWAEAHRNDIITFDEDLRDLACDLADTLRELSSPVSAESHLRAEITRREQKNIRSGKPLLKLALAETLFAQERFEEARMLCSDVQSHPNLLKMEKLRLHITMAKIFHVKSENHDALSYWNKALQEIGKYRLTNGRTTQIIVLSICGILRSLGYADTLRASLGQVEALDTLAKPGGVQYWIAGMRHWLEYLQSKHS